MFVLRAPQYGTTDLCRSEIRRQAHPIVFSPCSAILLLPLGIRLLPAAEPIC